MCESACVLNEPEDESAPVKHAAKWYCAACNECFCDNYHSEHKRNKFTRKHEVVQITISDNVTRYENTLTRCHNPDHGGAILSRYHKPSGKFVCNLCEECFDHESVNASQIIEEDYVDILQVLRGDSRKLNTSRRGTKRTASSTSSSSSTSAASASESESESESASASESASESESAQYPVSAELCHLLDARMTYELQMRSVLKEAAVAKYQEQLAALEKDRRNRLEEIDRLCDGTAREIKRELQVLRPIVQSITTVANNVGISVSHAENGCLLAVNEDELTAKRLPPSQAALVHDVKSTITHLSHLLESVNPLATQTYMAAAVFDRDLQLLHGFPSGETHNAIHVAIRTALDIEDSAPYHPSSSSSSSYLPSISFYTSSLPLSSPAERKESPRMSPNAAYHLLLTTSLEQGGRFNVPLVWFALGRCYQKGIGTASSLEYAIHWYAKAAKRGNLWALELWAEAEAEAIEDGKDSELTADDIEATACSRAQLYTDLYDSYVGDDGKPLCSAFETTAMVACALLVRLWGLYPSMEQIQPEKPMSVCEIFEQHLLNSAVNTRDPMTLFTILNVDFRHVVPYNTWLNTMARLAEATNLVAAHLPIATELAVGTRHYLDLPHEASERPPALDQWTSDLWLSVKQLIQSTKQWELSNDTSSPSSSTSSSSSVSSPSLLYPSSTTALAELCLLHFTGRLPLANGADKETREWLIAQDSIIACPLSISSSSSSTSSSSSAAPPPAIPPLFLWLQRAALAGDERARVLTAMLAISSHARLATSTSTSTETAQSESATATATSTVVPSTSTAYQKAYLHVLAESACPMGSPAAAALRRSIIALEACPIVYSRSLSTSSAYMGYEQPIE